MRQYKSIGHGVRQLVSRLEVCLLERGSVQAGCHISLFKAKIHKLAGLNWRSLACKDIYTLSIPWSQGRDFDHKEPAGLIEWLERGDNPGDNEP